MMLLETMSVATPMLYNLDMTGFLMSFCTAEYTIHPLTNVTSCSYELQ